MISIRRSYIYALLICFTFSYILMYVPTPSFRIMMILMGAGVLAAGYALQTRKGAWNFSLFLLMIWMMVMQFIREPSLGMIPTILYRTTAGFTSFSLMSSMGYEATRKPRKHDAFIKALMMVIILWCVFYIMSIDGQRQARNWGYANYVYMVFALFPFSFFLEKRIWRYVFVGILATMVIFSLKRTAFILLSVYALIALMHAFRHRRIRKRVFWTLTIVVVAGLSIVMFTDITQEFAEKYLYRFANAGEDGMGGRMEIWIAGLQDWWNRDFLRMLLGSNYSYQGLTMHNDYLEIFVNYGIVGLVLLIKVVISFFREYKFVKLTGYQDINEVMMFSLCNFAVLMLTSHIIIYPYMMFLCIMPIGYCNGVRRGLR